MSNLSISNSKLFFLYKLFQIFIILLVLDFSIGHTLRHFYFTQISGVNYRTTYSIEKTTADILIFGSSRANHHYIPQIFTDILNHSCYNVGRDGQGILYYSAVQRSILKRYKPKIIILDLWPWELIKSSESYDRLSRLLPYYKSHKEIRSIIELRSKFEKIKLLASIYPFNSDILTIAKYNIVREQDYNGYIPAFRVMEPVGSNDVVNNAHENLEIDDNKVKILESFIMNLKEAGIKLFVVISPIYRCDVEKADSMKVVKEIMAKYDVPFWDYSQNRKFIENPELFVDRIHLNNGGAELFSKIVAQRIMAEF